MKYLVLAFVLSWQSFICQQIVCPYGVDPCTTYHQTCEREEKAKRFETRQEAKDFVEENKDTILEYEIFYLKDG